MESEESAESFIGVLLVELSIVSDSEVEPDCVAEEVDPPDTVVAGPRLVNAALGHGRSVENRELAVVPFMVCRAPHEDRGAEALVRHNAHACTKAHVLHLSMNLVSAGERCVRLEACTVEAANGDPDRAITKLLSERESTTVRDRLRFVLDYGRVVAGNVLPSREFSELGRELQELGGDHDLRRAETRLELCLGTGCEQGREQKGQSRKPVHRPLRLAARHNGLNRLNARTT